ncbi:hypothetical protein [Clostridium polynesiense]|uniref:hypothetical protein n=1 Tax=Clostridium polynesiense TaxID=1325933 RepID=UPI00058F90C2|nr:hypothetical protein [Clostridium polynesiense]
MPWAKLKEMQLYDKLENHLKSVSNKDSKAVEDIITNKESLDSIKEAIHLGMDSRRIAEEMKLSLDQVDIIKDMLGKL